MAKKFNRGIINLKEIEDALSMESVLEHYGIKHENNRLECPLPNHFEKTGSFFLYENDKGEERFKCHGCGAKGKAINLVMEMEEIGFHDAVKVAEEITGIEIIYSKAMKHIVQDSNMDKIMKWLYETYFRKSEYWITTEDKSTTFIDYLKSRNIPKDVAYEYGLGFAKGSNNNYEGVYEDGLLDKAVELKVIPKRDTVEDAQSLIDAGLLYNPKGTDDLVATLRNAVVFPVIVNGKIKGFIGRNIDSTVRYIKTTNFGLWNSDYIEEGSDIILVEGCFDALCLNMIGLNAYALLGTHAMTNEVKQVLLRASRIYILFDDEKYKEEKGGTNSGGQGALDIAEELDYKAMICKPLGVKDINEALTNLYNTNRSTMDEDEAFNKAKEDLYERVLTVVYGKKVIGEDGEVVNDEDDEPVREGGAKSLVDIKLDKWLEITDEIKRIQGLRKLVEVAYKQYDGDSALLDIFADKLKLHGIKGTYFKEIIGKVKKEVSLEKPKSSSTNSSSLAVSNSNGEWVDWEVVDGVLYKNIPEFKEDGSGFVQEVISITAPSIKSILQNVRTKEEEIEISFIDRYKELKNPILLREAVVQKNSIVKALSNHGFDITEASANNIIAYLRYLENSGMVTSSNKKKLVDTTGYYDNNTYIGRRGEIITKQGLMNKEELDIVYKNLNNDVISNEITEIDDEKWKELVRNIFPKLIQLNERKNSIAVIAWFLASIYKEPIYNKNRIKAFPLLNIYGVQGAGKTALATILQQLLGGTDSIVSASTKVYTMIVNLSLSNAYPFLLDEYKLEDIKEFQNTKILNLAKVAYNSNIEQRGNGNKRMIDFALTSPLCVIGENSWTGEASDAVKDRSAILEFSKSWKEEHEKITDETIKEINKLDLNYFNGGYLKFVLNTLTGRFGEMYETAEKIVEKFPDKNNKLGSRNILTATILCFGIEVLKELYNTIGLESDITDNEYIYVINHALSHILDDEIKETSLDRVMSYFATTLKGEFNENEMVCDMDKKLLYVWQKKFFDRVEAHRIQNKVSAPANSGLKGYIKNNMKSGGYIKGTNETKSIQGKNMKCLVIDIAKLDEIAGIDKCIWTDEIGETKLYSSGTGSRVYLNKESADAQRAKRIKEQILNTIERETGKSFKDADTNVLGKEIYKRVSKGTEKGDLIEADLVNEILVEIKENKLEITKISDVKIIDIKKLMESK